MIFHKINRGFSMAETLIAIGLTGLVMAGFVLGTNILSETNVGAKIYLEQKREESVFMKTLHNDALNAEAITGSTAKYLAPISHHQKFGPYPGIDKQKFDHFVFLTKVKNVPSVSNIRVWRSPDKQSTFVFYRRYFQGDTDTLNNLTATQTKLSGTGGERDRLAYAILNTNNLLGIRNSRATNVLVRAEGSSVEETNCTPFNKPFEFNSQTKKFECPDAQSGNSLNHYFVEVEGEYLDMREFDDVSLLTPMRAIHWYAEPLQDDSGLATIVRREGSKVRYFYPGKARSLKFYMKFRARGRSSLEKIQPPESLTIEGGYIDDPRNPTYIEECERLGLEDPRRLCFGFEDLRTALVKVEIDIDGVSNNDVKKFLANRYQTFNFDLDTKKLSKDVKVFMSPNYRVASLATGEEIDSECLNKKTNQCNDRCGLAAGESNNLFTVGLAEHRAGKPITREMKNHHYYFEKGNPNSDWCQCYGVADGANRGVSPASRSNIANTKKGNPPEWKVNACDAVHLCVDADDPRDQFYDDYNAGCAARRHFLWSGWWKKLGYTDRESLTQEQMRNGVLRILEANDTTERSRTLKAQMRCSPDNVRNDEDYGGERVGRGDFLFHLWLGDDYDPLDRRLENKCACQLHMYDGETMRLTGREIHPHDMRADKACNRDWWKKYRAGTATDDDLACPNTLSPTNPDTGADEPTWLHGNTSVRGLYYAGAAICQYLTNGGHGHEDNFQHNAITFMDPREDRSTYDSSTSGLLPVADIVTKMEEIADQGDSHPGLADARESDEIAYNPEKVGSIRSKKVDFRLHREFDSGPSPRTILVQNFNLAKAHAEMVRDYLNYGGGKFFSPGLAIREVEWHSRDRDGRNLKQDESVVQPEYFESYGMYCHRRVAPKDHGWGAGHWGKVHHDEQKKKKLNPSNFPGLGTEDMVLERLAINELITTNGHHDCSPPDDGGSSNPGGGGPRYITAKPSH